MRAYSSNKRPVRLRRQRQLASIGSKQFDVRLKSDWRQPWEHRCNQTETVTGSAGRFGADTCRVDQHGGLATNSSCDSVPAEPSGLRPGGSLSGQQDVILEGRDDDGNRFRVKAGLIDCRSPVGWRLDETRKTPNSSLNTPMCPVDIRGFVSWLGSSIWRIWDQLMAHP